LDESELQALRNMTQGMDKAQRAMFYETKDKNVGIAMVLSIVIPGTGLMYIGKIGKGIIILLTSWLVVPYFYGLYATYHDSKAYNSLLYSIVFPVNESSPSPAAIPPPSMPPQGGATKFCTNCGTKISPSAAFCYSCGAKQA
jgi:TM2 domain-containing membrane protein YozV